MEKKESAKKTDNAQLKKAGFSHRVFGIIKFILGICLLPFVYSVSVSFLNEFSLIPKPLQNYFWAGLISFIIVYLFIYEPAIIYRKGQRLLEVVFSFFAPLVRVAPYLLPIYVIVIFVAYLLFSSVLKSPELIKTCLSQDRYFLFLFGFSLSLHLVFSARTLRLKQNDFLKANYIFGFSFIYIINLILFSFCLNFIFDNFSFVNFCNNSSQTVKNILSAIFKQLFL